MIGMALETAWDTLKFFGVLACLLLGMVGLLRR